MNPPKEFFDLYNLSQGVQRELSPGISTRIFPGDNAMLSIVRLDPNAEGRIHSHEEEQWGVLLEGNGVRIQGGIEVPVKAGNFWRTPSGVSHGIRAGTRGALVLDIFSPPRAAYKKAGTGFGID
jgi:quercetin dioxygenase-like cupin family protein